MAQQYEYMSPSGQICKKVGDPWVYLRVDQEWYCYDPQSTPLGGGAMGDVFLGYRVQNGAKVAVKRVKDAYANNPQIRARARQEASLAFRHPNMIEILGHCEWQPEAGPLFILSNYVQGEAVEVYAHAFAGADRAQRIVTMMLPVLDALSYIHSRGVVHRDIKPSNIMVENGNTVRLMDLGIARMTGGNKFSSFGFIGTPQYAAPEQILRSETPGEGAEINASTDVYAFGLTLYRLITGVNPFERPTVDETLGCQMTQTLPADPAIPPRLMKVLRRATAKKQYERYSTANALKVALEQAIDPNAPDSNPVIDFATRQPWLVAAAGVALVALLATLFLVI